MSGGMTWKQLQEALTAYPWTAFGHEDFHLVETTVRACQAAGRPLEVDWEAVEAMTVILQIEPLDTRFLLHKFEPGRGLLFLKKKPLFLVCTGQLTKDRWDMHLPGRSLEAALSAVVRPFELMDRQWKGMAKALADIPAKP
ncbi:hypothetical protein AncyloWKF20_07425 [Ancylobacter sp. WKF20]|uniref:hypothetical protein n=1 Tax=Ancylobacter sp. WKF20 TaxID=3039801 RepID=UPI0024342BE0|nr:hypothetical protein [Ancylobacter sp. WKF20]WGD31640.1 hypothetical protein AncyloWKF20_07425 [Ancylobacter sp. WKF20]